MNKLYIYIYPLFIGFPFHLGYQRVLCRLPLCSTTEYSRLSLSVFMWSSQPFACSLLTSFIHVLKSKPSAPQYLPSSTWGAHIPRADVPRGSPPCRERKHEHCLHPLIPVCCGLSFLGLLPQPLPTGSSYLDATFLETTGIITWSSSKALHTSCFTCIHLSENHLSL